MSYLRITKVPKHQKFDYTPRHYDAQKEDLEQRIEIAKGKQGDDVEAAKARMLTGMRRGRNTNPKLRKQLVFKSNMLLLGVLAFLVLALLLFVNVYLPGFVNGK